MVDTARVSVSQPLTAGLRLLNQEDENGHTPQQQALDAMLDIMYARQAAGDDAGVLEVAAKIAKCK